MIELPLTDDEPGVIKINFYMTPKCKYKCEYCTLYDNKLSHPDFDKDGWYTMLDNIPKAEIHIYGGEPIEHPEIYSIIKVLSEHKNVLNVNVLSNGSVIKKEKLKGLDVNILLSYHPHIKFKTFLKTVHNLEEYITRISYMYTGDSSIRTHEYKLFTRMFDFDTIFCPIVYDGKDNSPSLVELQKYPDFIQYLKDEKEYHFKEIKGSSTFKRQIEYGMYSVKDEVNCSINDTTIEVYNNHIFRCASALHYNIKIENFTLGIPVKDYIKFNKELSHKCDYKKCSVFDHKYIY